MELTKLPVPAPSTVTLSFMLGDGFVLQHTPLPVTADPPSEVIVPPDSADDEVIPDIAVVNTTGTDACG
jgi:hypothetical protein